MKDFSPTHRQVPLPSDPAVWVDSEMVDLLEFVRSAGCSTVASCQGQPDWAYILTSDLASLQVLIATAVALLTACEDWVTLAAATFDPSVARIRRVDPPERDRWWRYELLPEVTPRGVVTGDVGGVVRLPPEDLSRLTAHVRSLLA